jgi:NADPH:quinone reductase-like Zn-dependent oxidoreductase
MAKMSAIVVNDTGGPEVLKLSEVERPVPIPSEVLIRVRAVGLNPIEAFIRSGAFPAGQGAAIKPPFIPGWDISGIVDAVVPGVTRFQVGDEVFGMPFFPRAANAYAEYVVAPSRQVAKKPQRLNFAQAAALPLVGLTAWQALVDAAEVKPGQRVLIHAAAGGVGHLAVQIAKARGAYVVATASARKHDFVRQLGADQIIDYQAVDFTKATGDLDVVLELVGRDYGRRSIEVLRPGGLLVTAVERLNEGLKREVEAAGRRFMGITVEPDGRGLEALAGLVDDGKLNVHVERTFPLAEAARAHAALAGSLTGKLVLLV